MIKGILLLALIATLATSLKTRSVTLIGPSAYQSRYTVPSGTIAAGSTVTFTFASPKLTGTNPTFTYQVFRSSNDSPVAGPFEVTANAASVQDSSWTAGAGDVAQILYAVIELTSSLSQFEVV